MTQLRTTKVQTKGPTGNNYQSSHRKFQADFHFASLLVALVRPIRLRLARSKKSTFNFPAKTQQEQQTATAKPFEAIKLRVTKQNKKEATAKQYSNMDNQSKKRSRPPSPYPKEAETSQEQPSNKKQSKGLAAVVEENNRLKALHANTVENERLKAQVDALTESNMEKVTELENLKKKIASAQDKLKAADQELEARKQTNANLTNELKEKEQQLHEIHASWQQQVTDYAEKQSTVDSLQTQFQEVQDQFHRDTQSLIAERQRRKQLQERLEELRKAYESQGQAAQWHSIVRGGTVAMATVKKDCS